MRASKTILLVVIAASLYGCRGGGGASGSSGEPVTLRLTGKKGDKYGMDVSMQMATHKENANDTLTATLRLTEELLDVGGNHYAWQETVDDVQATGTGELQGVAAALQSRKGQSKSKAFDERNRPQNETEDFLDVTFPERAVKPGDTWEDNVRFQKETAGARYKFERREKVSGFDTAVISMAIAADHLKTPQPMMNWIDVKTGQLVKQEGSVELTGLPGSMLMMLKARRI